MVKIYVKRMKFKYLGVVLDKHLSWKYHISSLATKLQKAIGIISKLKYCLPEYLLRFIHYSFFHSDLIYNLISWSCDSPTNLIPVELLGSCPPKVSIILNNFFKKMILL